MTFGMRRNVLRPTDSPRADRVTYVELFFDLVFVFALTQLSAYLYENQTPLGALEGVIMVCALWWAWVSTTWVTNWLDPVKLPVRGAVVALAFVSFVMSVAIAEAFGDRAWTFAIAYVVLQVGRTGFIVWATARHDRAVSRDFTLHPRLDRAPAPCSGSSAPCCRCRRSCRSGPPPSASSCSARYSAIRVPGSGGCSIASWDVSGPHIAERTALFVLIALGEGLLVTGFAFVAMESSPDGDHRDDRGVRRGRGRMVDLLRPRRAHRLRGDRGRRRTGPTRPHGLHMDPPRDHRRHRADERRRQGGARPPARHSFAATVVTLGGPLLFLVGTVLFRRVLEHRWAAPRSSASSASCVLATASPVLDALGESVAVALLLVARRRRARRSAGCAGAGAAAAERRRGIVSTR